MVLEINEIKTMDALGIQRLVQEEGVVRRAYRDSVGIWTIGIGMTFYPDTGARVKQGDILSMEDVMRYFKMMLKPFELGVYSVTRDDINQNMFNALVSLAYNIGTSAFKKSTLLKRVNADPYHDDIDNQFLEWRNAGGEPVLLARRKREVDLYFKPIGSGDLNYDALYIEHIKYIQGQLNKALKLTLDEDGIFGKGTLAALKAFQTKARLNSDGIAGPATMQALNKY